MYNSTNLPLSKKKILKKTLQNSPALLLLFIVSLVFVVLGFLTEVGFIFFMSVIAFLLFFFILTLVVLYNYYYYKLYYYDFKEDSAEIRKGVVSRATGHVRYERIQNILVSPKIVYIRAILTFLTYYFIFVFAILYGGASLLEEGMISPSFLAGFGLIATLIILICSYFMQKIWYKNFYFKFDNELGQIKTQIIAQKTSYIYYDRIQNINMIQGILDRIFGLYNVRIETAAETSKSASSFAVPGLNSGDAEKLKNFLLPKARFGKNNL